MMMTTTATKFTKKKKVVKREKLGWESSSKSVFRLSAISLHLTLLFGSFHGDENCENCSWTPLEWELYTFFRLYFFAVWKQWMRRHAANIFFLSVSHWIFTISSAAATFGRVELRVDNDPVVKTTSETRREKMKIELHFFLVVDFALHGWWWKFEFSKSTFLYSPQTKFAGGVRLYGNVSNFRSYLNWYL